MYNHLIAKRFTSLLKETGISQAFIAKQLNLSRNAVNSWAKGRKQPDQKNLSRLAKLLHVDPAYLTGESDYRTEEERIAAAFDTYHGRISTAKNFFLLWLRTNNYIYIRSVVRLKDAEEIDDQTVQPITAMPGRIDPDQNTEVLSYIYSKDPKSVDAYGIPFPMQDEIELTLKDENYFPLEILDFIEMRMKQITDYNRIGSEDRYMFDAIHKAFGKE